MCRQNKMQLKFLSFFKFTKIFILSITLILSFSENLLANTSVRLKRLQAAEYLDFNQSFNDKDLVMLFQPECSSCKAQIQELACLNQESIKLLGVHESEERIETEYKRLKTKIQGLYIDPQALQSINPKLEVMTPMFFLVKKTTDKKDDPKSDQNIKLLKIAYGYQKCGILLKKLKNQI